MGLKGKNGLNHFKAVVGFRIGEDEMKELVEIIAKALVDQPDSVSVEESQGTHTHVMKLRVAKEDIGKVIGKKGTNANAIRTILDAAGGKQNRRYVLEILE